MPYLQRATELAPDDLEVEIVLWDSSCKYGIIYRSSEEFRFVIEHDEENADAHYNLGFLYAVSTDRKEDALIILKKHLQLIRIMNKHVIFTI